MVLLQNILRGVFFYYYCYRILSFPKPYKPSFSFRFLRPPLVPPGPRQQQRQQQPSTSRGRVHAAAAGSAGEEALGKSGAYYFWLKVVKDVDFFWFKWFKWWFTMFSLVFLQLYSLTYRWHMQKYIKKPS